MKSKHVYIALCVMGAAIPYSQFLPWVAQNGLNLRLFLQQLFANRISAFFGADVIVSAIVLVVFMYFERRRSNVPFRWLPVAALLLVGVSLALPLFLYLRERGLDHETAIAISA